MIIYFIQIQNIHQLIIIVNKLFKWRIKPRFKQLIIYFHFLEWKSKKMNISKSCFKTKYTTRHSFTNLYFVFYFYLTRDEHFYDLLTSNWLTFARVIFLCFRSITCTCVNWRKKISFNHIIHDTSCVTRHDYCDSANKEESTVFKYDFSDLIF